MRMNVIGGVMGLALLASGCGSPEETPGTDGLDFQQASQAATTAPAFFVFTDGTKSEFVFQINDPKMSEYARTVLARGQKANVAGLLIKKKAAYNSQWSYQLDPTDVRISVGGMSMEVCDATIQYVEAHLAEAGGSFLPGNRWCPWKSVLLREVKR